MYAQAAVKPNTLLRNGAYGIVMRGVHFCARGCSSLRGRNRLPLCCIKLDTATDPAVGSGAFLLGLLNEIVRARQTITAYMTIEMNSFERFDFYAYGHKAYDLKVNTIKNCLFACDVEPSATDITKLRLWLSIVIDDELVKQDDSEGLYDAYTEPRPLPNLACNIICGNSLMDEFEGIKLITESSILNNQAETGMDSFYQAGFDNMLQELIKLQDELYFTKQHETKQEIKKKIHAIYDRIILHQLESNPSAVEKYKKVKDAAQSNKQWFELWNSRKMQHFYAEKFVFSELGLVNDFVRANECFYTDSACGMEFKDEFKKYNNYIYKYLNSNILTYIYKKYQFLKPMAIPFIKMPF